MRLAALVLFAQLYQRTQFVFSLSFNELPEKSEAKKDCQPATKSVKPRLCPVVVLFSSVKQGITGTMHCA